MLAEKSCQSEWIGSCVDHRNFGFPRQSLELYLRDFPDYTDVRKIIMVPENQVVRFSDVTMLGQDF